MVRKIINTVHRLKWILLVLALSIPTVLPLFQEGYFKMHDDISYLRVHQMEGCFSDFQIPCRWVADMGYGYGYPQFQYYGPFPYYLMTLSRYFGVDLFFAVNLAFASSLVLGNISMFLLGSLLFGNFGGLLSSVAYAYSPFRSGDVYSRGAMGESWAFVFLPLIIYGLIKLYKNPKIQESAKLGVYIGLLVTTHNISTFIFAPLIFILGICLLVVSRHKKNFLRMGLLSILISVGISAFFLLPVVFEKQYAHTESLIQGYFNYLAHFVSLKQLFVSTFWGYGSSEIGPTDDLSFFLGPIQLFGFILSFGVLVVNFLRRKISFSGGIFALSSIFLVISLFMSHEKSSYIWKLIPPLTYLQFPWRFLVLANLFLCLGSGYFVSEIKKPKVTTIVAVFCTLFIFFNVSYFRPHSWYHYTIEEKFSGRSWVRQLTTSIFDYLPIYSKLPPTSHAPQLPLTDEPIGILDYIQRTNKITFQTHSVVDTQVSMPQFDFPGWQVYLNGKKIPHHHDNKLGLISFSLPQGSNQVVVRLEDTPVRALGNFLSFITIPLVIYLIRRPSKTT